MWTIEERRFELKYNWKLSRNEALYKTNLFVKVFDQYDDGWGEIAPNIRYQETPDVVKEQFRYLLSKGLNNITNILDYHDFIKYEKVSNCLKCGLEAAITSLTLKQKKCSFSGYYKIKKVEKLTTSYTIPIMEPNKIEGFITDNKLNRFHNLKLKVNSELGLEIIKEVAKYYKQPLIIDANEAWSDVETHIFFLEKLDKFNILFIEQPLPEAYDEQFIYLKKYSPYPIFADESVKDETDLEHISKQFHGINVKLMKTGGYTRAIQLIKLAEKYKLRTMIGCMVETTLGISNAMNLVSSVDYVDLDGFMLIKDEPFELIKEDQGELYWN